MMGLPVIDLVPSDENRVTVVQTWHPDYGVVTALVTFRWEYMADASNEHKAQEFGRVVGLGLLDFLNSRNDKT